jgi:hypothetical protein
MDAEAELRDREPIFHRSPSGTTREAFATMIADDYWEVGASGTVYRREAILDVLERRYADPAYDPMAGLEVSDFACRAAGEGTWLVTYHLRQDARLTRRLSVWRHEGDRWIALYHQGTVIA